MSRPMRRAGTATPSFRTTIVASGWPVSIVAAAYLALMLLNAARLPARTDDDEVIGRLRLWTVPRRLPPLVVLEALLEKRPE